jgi:hypothetical protein
MYWAEQYFKNQKIIKIMEAPSHVNEDNKRLKDTFINTYIPLTLYPQSSSKRFSYEEYYTYER